MRKEEIDMKRRILAFACAAVMVLGMGMTVFAAGSSTASDTRETPVFQSAVQSLSAATIAAFPEVTAVEGATVTAVSPDVAAAAVSEAGKVYGNNTFIATLVDINVPGATFPYTFTIYNPNVWAGQKVTILHYVDEKWERITPGKVADNAVTLTTNSFSPFAVVIDADTSPKTMDIALIVSGFAGLFAAGAVLTGKKKE